MASIREQTGSLSQPAASRNAYSASADPGSFRRLGSASVPLSLLQEELWHAQVADGRSLRNHILTLERRSSLDCQLLQTALEEIMHRHAILRTAFTDVNGSPAQTTCERGRLNLSVTDVSGFSESQRKSSLLKIVAEEAVARLEPGGLPVVRAHVLQISDRDHILLIALHPLVADDHSLTILARELVTCYEMLLIGEEIRLPDLPLQYTEYAHWQATHYTGDALEQELSYWRERLTAISSTAELPMLQTRASTRRESRGSHEITLLSKDSAGLLEAISEEEGVTLSVTLLASFVSLLSRYHAQQQFVIACMVTGRNEPATESLIGPFANRVIINADVESDPTFSELLKQVSGVFAAGCEHQSLPFKTLIGKLQPKHDFSPNFLDRVLFSFAPRISLPESAWEFAGFREATDDAADTVDTDLHVKLFENSEGITARFMFKKELFDSETISRMAAHFQTLVGSIVEDPHRRVSRMQLLTRSEQDLLLRWNDTGLHYTTEQCVHEIFEEQVKRTPDSIAVRFGDEQLTYSQLNSRSNKLARYLVDLGAGPNALIGICVERSLDLLVGLIGIMKSGAAYVPLDPQYPPSRLSLMVDDSGLKLLVTHGYLRAKFPEYKGRFVCLESKIIDQNSPENYSGGGNSENLAYVIYTSGSTGKPKGVEICHRSLVNFLTSMRSRPGFTAQDVLLAVTTVSFDIAALELYLPLTVGGSLIIVGRDVAADGYNLQEVLQKASPTVMQATPATWRLLLESGWAGNDNLKILCGGEGMPRELATELLKRSSSVWNMYGPTETTVWSTTCQITATDGPITIGTPIANTEIYVLDRQLEPLPVGIAGELYIGGDGVARGYLHRPELTRDRFIDHPFRDRGSGQRLYRTGDLARYRADGQIECLGRIDNQVKVRGFRIELGEIESVLSEHQNVKHNVVVAREDTPGDKRLVAYIIPNQQAESDIAHLRKFVKQRLPEYMVPSQFVFLDSFPLTPNGKVDRKALPAPEQLESREDKEYIAAGNTVELELLKIWTSVLGSSAICVTDNFFELGGHSLLVAKLLRHIEQAFGKKLPAAAIFQAPTIEQQAALLRNGSAVLWPSALIPVQPAGTRPPFFWCGFGAGPVFRPLAQRLGPDQPLLAIDPTLLNMNELAGNCEMSDIAACLIKQIHEVHPRGPYYVGGFCGGGLVAYEVASQLLAQGHQVPLLVLLEPHPAHQAHYLEHSNGFSPSWLRKRLTFHVGNLRHILNGNEAQAYIRDHIRERSRVYYRSIERVFKNALSELRPVASNGRARNTRDLVDNAYRKYCPRPFVGQVALFQATHREPGGEWERQYWSDLVARLDVHEIPGYSNWLVRFFVEPSVEALANTLTPYLLKSGAENSSPLKLSANLQTCAH